MSVKFKKDRCYFTLWADGGVYCKNGKKKKFDTPEDAERAYKSFKQNIDRAFIAIHTSSGVDCHYKTLTA